MASGVKSMVQQQCKNKIEPLVKRLAAGALMMLAAASPSLADSALLDKADMGYGEYLSGECVTCHQKNGSNQGLPSITGLDPEGFIAIMLAYRNKELSNNVMQTVAGRLDDEQIASLAVYFASLPAGD
jgi:cytochrome c